MQGGEGLKNNSQESVLSVVYPGLVWNLAIRLLNFIDGHSSAILHKLLTRKSTEKNFVFLSHMRGELESCSPGGGQNSLTVLYPLSADAEYSVANRDVQ